MKWTNELLTADYWGAGLTTYEIAQKYGCTQSNIVLAMQRHGVARRNQAVKDQRGTKNPAWQSNTSNYFTLHKRLRAKLGKPVFCSVCGTTDPAKKYDWANMTGRFDDPTDYKRVCKSCHAKHDRWGENLKGRAS